MLTYVSYYLIENHGKTACIDADAELLFFPLQASSSG